MLYNVIYVENPTGEKLVANLIVLHALPHQRAFTSRKAMI